MLGLCYHSDNLKTWGRIDANRYNKTPEDVQEHILDAVAGVNGAKVCRDLCSLDNDKKALNDYVQKYARRVNKSCTNVKEGYEVNLINQEEVDANYGVGHTVMEFTVGYFEQQFDTILNDLALDELMSEFALVRKHIMYETNSDIAIIMSNVVDENENTARAKTALYSLCEKYELRDFFTDLLSCGGAVDRIVQMAYN